MSITIPSRYEPNPFRRLIAARVRSGITFRELSSTSRQTRVQVQSVRSNGGSRMLDDIGQTLRRLESSVVEDPVRGVSQCRRDIFTDAELFELEMKYIRAGNWIYLAHETQIP